MAQVSSTVSESGQPVERLDRVSIVEAGLDGVGECESVPTRGVTLIGEGRFVFPRLKVYFRGREVRKAPEPPLAPPEAGCPSGLSPPAFVRLAHLCR